MAILDLDSNWNRESKPEPPPGVRMFKVVDRHPDEIWQFSLCRLEEDGVVNLANDPTLPTSSGQFLTNLEEGHDRKV